MRVRLVGSLALMALVLASCGGVSPGAAGPSEGIQVHGDWTIDIYNEDGSLDEHVVFSNALTELGAEGLVNVLTRQRNVGDWGIWLNNPDEALKPCDPAGVNCLTIQEPNSVYICNVNCSKSLALVAEGQSILLSGSVEASRNGQIAVVGTQFVQDCPPETSDPCSGFNPGFTEKTLADPIGVSDGQTVQVEVAISFTSG